MLLGGCFAGQIVTAAALECQRVVKVIAAGTYWGRVCEVTKRRKRRRRGWKVGRVGAGVGKYYCRTKLRVLLVLSEGADCTNFDGFP